MVRDPPEYARMLPDLFKTTFAIFRRSPTRAIYMICPAYGALLGHITIPVDPRVSRKKSALNDIR